MSEIIWKEPPPAKKGRRPEHEARKQAMRDNPGRWLYWGHAASLTIATRLRREGFETRSSRREDKKFDIYVRVPEGTPTADADPALVRQRERFEATRRQRLGRTA